MPPLSPYSISLQNTCNTEGCIAASNFLNRSVNLTIDPCLDFFQYACGNWLSIDAIKANTRAYDSYDEVEDGNIIGLIRILEGSYEDVLNHLKTNADGFNMQDQADIDRNNFQLSQDYYRVCMNEQQIFHSGPTSLFENVAYIQKTLGSGTDKAGNVASVLAFFTRQKIPSLLAIKTSSYDKNHTINAPGISDVDFDKGSYNDDPVDVDDIIKKIESTLGVSNNDQHIIDESQRVGLSLWTTDEVKTAVRSYVDIKKKLKEIIENIPDSGDEKYTNLQQAQLVSSNINWESFLSNMISPEYVKQPSASIFTTSSKHLLVEVDKLVSALSVKELQDFFSVRFVLHKYDDLILTAPSNFNDEVVADSQQYQDNIDQHPFSASQMSRDQSTTKEPSERQKRCSGEVGKHLYNNIGRYFVLETLGGTKEKQDVDDLVHDFQETFVNHLHNIEWLDEPTRKSAIDKVKAIRPRIGFNTDLPDWRNPTSIRDYFQNVAVNSSNYFQTRSDFTAWMVDKQWKALGSNALEHWSDTGYIQEVNAFYSEEQNELEVPIGILQQLQFDHRFPKYINYGAVGSTIGHEFTHSLDSDGRKLDSGGYPSNWFSSGSAQNFEDKSKCFVDQFSKDYLYNEIDKTVHRVDGKATLAENIADAGGVTLAILAYRNYASKLSQPEDALPGFESFTPEQMLFISFGASQCAFVPPDLRGINFDDVHAPWRFRVMNSMINSPEFTSAFKCAAGTPMNPHKSDSERCSIW